MTIDQQLMDVDSENRMPSLDSRDIDRALAKLDKLGDRDTLRRQAEAFKAEEKLEPASRYDGTDPTRSIWIGVNPRGRVLSVDIGSTWRSRLGPEQFADALFSAYSAALRKAFATELTARRAAPAEKPASEPLVDNTDGLSIEEWLAVTRAKLRRIDEQLRDLPTSTTVPDREIRSPNGYLTLRLTAGGIAGITGHTDALKRAKLNLLRQDVLDAFQDANLTAEH